MVYILLVVLGVLGYRHYRQAKKLKAEKIKNSNLPALCKCKPVAVKPTVNYKEVK